MGSAPFIAGTAIFLRQGKTKKQGKTEQDNRKTTDNGKTKRQGKTTQDNRKTTDKSKTKDKENQEGFLL